MAAKNRFADIHSYQELNSLGGFVSAMKKSGKNAISNRKIEAEFQKRMGDVPLPSMIPYKEHDLIRKWFPETHKIVVDLVERRRFLKQLGNLGISEEVLRGANRIVDVGAGDRGFAVHMARIGVSTPVVSIDPHAKSDGDVWNQLSFEQEEGIEALTIREHIEDAPLEEGSADLVIAHNLHFDDNCHKRPIGNPKMLEGVMCMRESVKKVLEPTFRGMAKLVSDKGQVRIYPFNPKNDARVLDALESLEKNDGYKIKFEEVEPIEGGRGDAQSHQHSSSDFRIVISK